MEKRFPEKIIAPHFSTLSRVALAISLITILFLALAPIENDPLPAWNDKIKHLLAFAVLSALVDASWKRAGFNLPKAGGLLLYGLLIECLQWMTGYRFFSIADLLADGLGILLYWQSIPVLRKVPVIRLRWLKELDGM